ncbi:MAG TPA: serine hydrolase, partial [Cyanobacteria bacterium UBA11049]|nr:serine hydrolase [Cyanobacteria bacterium UBA11049]
MNLNANIEDYLKAHEEIGNFMGSVLVVCRDEVLFEGSYGMAELEHNIPNTPQTKFRLGSITKQFTAAAILQLQEQGRLNVNAPVSAYLPNYPNGDRITIHQLLNHTSGIPNFTSFPDYEQMKRRSTSLDELIAWFKDKPLDFTPGDGFSYSNS